MCWLIFLKRMQWKKKRSFFIFYCQIIMNNQKINKIIYGMYWGLILAMPLFFLRLSSNYSSLDSFSKSSLLWIVAPLLLFLLVYKKIKEEKVVLKSSLLNQPIVVLAFFLILSGIFGIDFKLFFWGNPSVMILPFMSFISLLCFFYFSINYLKDEKVINWIYKTLLVSYSLAVIFVALFFVLKWLNLIVLSSFVMSVLSLAVGSFEEFSMYLAPLTILAMIASFDRRIIVLPKTFIKIVFALSVFLLLIINYIPSWWVLFVGTILVFLYHKSRKEVDKSTFFSSLILVMPIAVIVVLVLNFTVTGQYSVFRQRSAANFQLDFGNSAYVAKEALRNDFLLGQGSESFPFLYSKYRSPDLNKTAWWDIRFNKSFSFALDFLISGGILVFLAYLFFIVSILILVYRLYRKISILEYENATIPELTLLLVVLLIFEQFIFSFNIVLLFIFFLLLAAQMFYTEKFDIILFKNRLNKSNHLLASSKMQKIFFSLGAVLLVLFIIDIQIIKIWTAELFYQKANEAQDLGLKERYLSAANSLHENQFRYQVSLAKIFRDKALLELKKGAREKDLKMTENFVNSAIGLSKKAVISAPYSVVPFEILGTVYRDLVDFSPDSLKLAVVTFKQAEILEPSNPIILTEIGKLLLRNKEVNDAELYFRKAIKAKPDLSDASVYLSRALANQGKYEEALMELGKLELALGTPEVKFEIGRVYFNQNKYSAAETKFQEVIALAPVNANALYSLGLSLEKQGKTAEAILYYRRALNLNPNNLELKQKIGSLEK